MYRDILLNKIKYGDIKKMSINEIIDIGPKLNISKNKFKNININSRNYIKKISLLVKRFKSWFVFYPIGQMTKSGIVAICLTEC